MSEEHDDAASAPARSDDEAAPPSSPESGGEPAEEVQPPAASPAKVDSKEDKPRGNPLRRAALVPMAIGILGAFALMAQDGHVPFGIPLGTLFVAVASFGILDLFGTFDDTHAEPSATLSLAALGLPLGRTAALLIAFFGSLAAAGMGLASPWLMGIVVTASFLGLIASIFDVGVQIGAWATDEHEKKRPLLHRHGFWVVALGGLLYLPSLGVFSLWDPWETHYGEVAREILARDDWISLWWAQDGWFWSKPILNFWMQSLAMGSLGTHYSPDQMLIGIGGHPVAHPEWIVRAPNVLLTLVAMYFIYKGVARIFGRRAGLLGGIVLATMPDWYFLAHQTMADMPYVAPLTAAMGLLLLGLNTDPERKTRLYALNVGARTLRLSGVHLALGAVALCAIPQILYLATRNLDIVLHGTGAHGIRFHFDEFQSGSAGNCGLPGNEACHQTFPAMSPRNASSVTRFLFGFEPMVQAILWAAALGALLHLNRGERRVQRLYYIGAWFFAAIATMGKGPVGIFIPLTATFLSVLSTRRFAEILKFETWSGILIIGCVAAPWFVAMYVRHGSPFTDRLFIHDMFNRTLGHVHDTNEGDDTSFRFYIWQLGYALFPWVGLAPLGLTFWARRRDTASRGGGVFLVLWFVLSFFLFSFMGTKFHHYIFPAVPPTAMLVGIALDEMMGKGSLVPSGRSLVLFLGSAVVLALLAVFGVSLAWPGTFLGNKPASGELAGAMPRIALAVTFAVIGGIITWLRVFYTKEPEPQGRAVPTVTGGTPFRGGVVMVPGSTDVLVRQKRHVELVVGAAVVAGLFALVLVGRDLAAKGESADQPGAIRFLQLFTYNYRRPWPVEDLDFTATLTATALVAVALTFLLALPAVRRQAAVLFSAFAIVVAFWGTDVYMVKVSPHWGQREVIEAYYKDRRGPDEQLVAYQMNWKGENFYTSNRIPAFVSSGAAFTAYIKQQKDKGQKVMYFVTEHSRTGGLRSEVGAKSYREITDKKLCNKFVLVRAEL
jgi:4-amino-4-deoxy-L-arabinose transferase-like glycosyltransferase